MGKSSLFVLALTSYLRRSFFGGGDETTDGSSVDMYVFNVCMRVRFV